MTRLDTQDTPITDVQLAGLGRDLCNMQGHILRSHGRELSVHIFLQFLDREKAKEWIAEIADKRITSAKKQLEHAERYTRTDRKIVGDVFWCFFLSTYGYETFRIPKPSDPAFQDGMAKRQASADVLLQQSPGTLLTLNDPPPNTWDNGYQEPIEAMLLIADDNEQNLPWADQKPWAEQLRAVEDYLEKFEVGIQAVAKVCAIEYGRVMRRPDTEESYEHFGYVDGRSQPLFFEKDVIKEQAGGGINRWNPAAGPRLVLVEDSNGTPYNGGNPAYGSYLVFRKLKQDVNGFNNHLKRLETTLALQGHDQRRAEALVMGRFRDGTPIVLQSTPGQYKPVSNNFDFTNDPQGVRCPFQAHIRRVNPRGERDRNIRSVLDAALRRLQAAAGEKERGHILSILAATLKRLSVEGQGNDDDRIQSALDRRYDERQHHIARRSVPYGKEQDPEVGLLFMCYQSDICQQFEFLQANWANNEDFPEQGTGLDAIIGRSRAGHKAPDHHWPLRWNAKQGGHKSCLFQSFVTLKGGEYFFAPSLPFLRNITQIGAS
jgi:deferrochelatase/peroxidase EfeB